MIRQVTPDSEDTLKFSVASNIRPMIETFPRERAAEAFARMMSGKARFRVVLVPDAWAIAAPWLHVRIATGSGESLD